MNSRGERLKLKPQTFVNLLKLKNMAFETIDVQENGNGQFLQIPNDFKIDDQKVILRKVGNILMVIPKNHAWDVLFDSLLTVSDDFLEDRNQGVAEVRESLD